MLVIDTSAFLSLASVRVLETVLEEYEPHTTEIVLEELQQTAEYEDLHTKAAQRVIELSSRFQVDAVETEDFKSSRIDKGEYSCVVLADRLETEFILTDDFRALPELKSLVDCQVAISPIMLKALAVRDRITEKEAKEKLDKLAENRNWIGSPIYRHAKNIF
jgi:predicted nucleic acid-binding protein